MWQISRDTFCLQGSSKCQRYIHRLNHSLCMEQWAQLHSVIISIFKLSHVHYIVFVVGLNGSNLFVSMSLTVGCYWLLLLLLLTYVIRHWLLSKVMYITICIVLIWDRAVPWALSASSVCPVLIIIIITSDDCAPR